RKCVDLVAALNPADVLDLATGTGDLAVSLAKAIPEARITGGDLSEGMLEVGRSKVERLGLSDRITLQVADALNLPFADNSFDAITIGFGVRNFEHLDRGYAEMARVLRPGGLLVVLELTPPASKAVRPFYNFYTRAIIPAVGRVVSHDSRAYTYLPESIAAVPARDDMTALMSEAGLTGAKWKSLAFGAATIYTATKPL
ncbi:MAG: ubiquinone/menaquinone biosynthesis methyltransferase, partial [Muribaculaceae bacterium]|nr:ubiquinone/menaquinone biosynthesis methyltransferase [Muribaculaceae bacterium]